MPALRPQALYIAAALTMPDLLAESPLPPDESMTLSSPTPATNTLDISLGYSRLQFTRPSSQAPTDGLFLTGKSFWKPHFLPQLWLGGGLKVQRSSNHPGSAWPVGTGYEVLVSTLYRHNLSSRSFAYLELGISPWGQYRFAEDVTIGIDSRVSLDYRYRSAGFSIATGIGLLDPEIGFGDGLFLSPFLELSWSYGSLFAESLTENGRKVPSTDAHYTAISLALGVKIH